jgi:hypothetical protein
MIGTGIFVLIGIASGVAGSGLILPSFIRMVFSFVDSDFCYEIVKPRRNFVIP